MSDCVYCPHCGETCDVVYVLAFAGSRIGRTVSCADCVNCLLDHDTVVARALSPHDYLRIAPPPGVPYCQRCGTIPVEAVFLIGDPDGRSGGWAMACQRCLDPLSRWFPVALASVQLHDLHI